MAGGEQFREAPSGSGCNSLYMSWHATSAQVYGSDRGLAQSLIYDVSQKILPRGSGNFSQTAEKF